MWGSLVVLLLQRSSCNDPVLGKPQGIVMQLLMRLSRRFAIGVCLQPLVHSSMTCAEPRCCSTVLCVLYLHFVSKLLSCPPTG